MANETASFLQADEKSEELKQADLETVVGGNGYPQGQLHLATPKVKNEKYLALRSQPCWDDRNEIDQISNGERFYVDVTRIASGSGYNYYWANYNGTWGWVNNSFITLLD